MKELKATKTLEIRWMTVYSTLFKTPFMRFWWDARAPATLNPLQLKRKPAPDTRWREGRLHCGVNILKCDKKLPMLRSGFPWVIWAICRGCLTDTYESHGLQILLENISAFDTTSYTIIYRSLPAHSCWGIRWLLWSGPPQRLQHCLGEGKLS